MREEQKNKLLFI